ncbi:MAG: hypothetical protein JWN44_5636 [Myxococcales bacterium]|nr:hypothetical protein [Myxococcales bacterium]
MRRMILGLLLVAGCADDGTSGGDGGGNADLATAGTHDMATSPPDLTPYNPQNPAGAGPAVVDVGTAANLASAGAYVLLAKTGITNVTGSMITGGHLGVSPAAASTITGFALSMPPSTFSTSASVVAPSKVYASDYTTPTPTNLTTAVLSMQGAYTDAAGRTNPDFLNLSGGNLAGLTLVPGLYTWGTGVTIPNDVTLSGGANDVWIFQISNDLDVTTGKKVNLTGGALAKNVFWQVAGQVTIHANAHFEGVILCKTGITLQTNATMTGRALSQSLVAIDNNAITAP